MDGEPPTPPITRREFLKAAGYTAGLAALSGCRLPFRAPRPPDLPAERRTVWAWADSHIGRVAAGKDGGEWTELAIRDLLQNVGAPDYALVLGDITHGAREAAFKTYARLRRESGIRRWYELIGNHDYRGVESGLCARFVRPQQRYVLRDGNLVWIFLSAERGRAAGILQRPTRVWLRRVLAAHQDKNVVVCSHQLAAHTIRYSDPRSNRETILNPVNWIADLRREFRIDVWLCGHEHGPKRDRRQIRRIGPTTFVNVASLSHLYGTQASNSFSLEMVAGEREIRARCRRHDSESYDARFGTTIPLPFPLRLDRQPRIIDVHTAARTSG